MLDHFLDRLVRLSPRRLYLYLALFLFVTMEVVSWLTSQPPSYGCIVDPKNYGDYQGDDQCPTFHVFLIVSVTRILAAIGHDWVLAIATAVIAWLTITLAKVGRQQIADTRILQRAYISAEPGGITPFEDTLVSKIPEKRIACNIVIYNAGNLPATHVAWFISKKFSGDPELPESLLQIENPKGNIVIAPNTRTKKGSKPANREEFDAIRNDAEEDKAWLYVFGKITYHDGFRDGRWITFCHRYNLRGARGYDIPEANGRYHEQGNRTDEG